MARSIVSTDALEPIKWVAACAMLIEHVAHFVFGVTAAWPYIIGRAAFPLFGLALAVGVAGKTIDAQRRTALKLAGWGLLTALAVATVKEPAPMNVLCTFALGVGADAMLRSSWRYRWVALIASWPICFAVEYGPLGVAAVALLCSWARAQGSLRASWRAAAAVALVALVPGNLVSLIWWPLAAIISAASLTLPRARGAFYWIYAAQWPVMAVAKAVL